MKLIVGLGNIGKEYETTRHNIGFMVADAIAKKHEVSFNKEERDAMVAEFRVGGEKILIIKPTTFMNDSGVAVGQFARFYNIAPKDIVIIHDDMDLPVGFLRIRPNGSSGGHNGIKSVQSHLGTDGFVRFRVGIGHPVHEHKVVLDYVLTKFNQEEQKIMTNTIDNVANAADAWITDELEKVMNKYNSKKVKKDNA
ncbi:MAG: aminoacyl-tRNA hydrolase [Phascolarctobacterium sp.]|nr:aminoacyl-tRNA hydrolase [Phascolarctobacterium sp.]